MKHYDPRSWDKYKGKRWFCWSFGLYAKWVWITSVNRYKSIPGVARDNRPETWCCNHAVVNLFTGQQDDFLTMYLRPKGGL